MLHDKKDMSRLVVNAQQVEEKRFKRKNRGYKMDKAYVGCTSKVRLEIQDKPKFRERVSNQVPSKFPRTTKDRVYNPKSQNARSEKPLSDKATCSKCGEKHWGECLVWKGNCFGCGKEVHKLKDFPNVMSQEKGSGQCNKVALVLNFQR